MWAAYQYDAWNWFLTAITFTLVVNRVYVNFRGLRAKVRWFRDALVVTSWIFFLISAALTSIIIASDYYNYDWNLFLERPISEQIQIAKLSYISQFFYLPGIYLNKIDLLFLYHDLAPRRHHPKIFKMIIFVWVFVIAGLLASILGLFLQCIPISYQWQTPQSQAAADCTMRHWYYAMIWSTHMFSDVVLYLLPLIIIKQMQGRMSLRQKLSVASMFGMGFVNIACAIIIVAVSLVIYVTFDTVGATLFVETAQPATAILVVCMPHVRSTYRLLRGDKGAGEVRGMEEGRNAPPAVVWPSTIRSSTHGPVSVTIGVDPGPAEIASERIEPKSPKAVQATAAEVDAGVRRESSASEAGGGSSGSDHETGRRDS